MLVTEMPYIDNKEWNRTMGTDDNTTDEQSNEIIEYFQLFKSYQETEKKKVINHTFKNAATVVNSLLEALKQRGFQIKDVFLKFDNSTSMTALFMVDDDVFCSDQFDEAYNLALHTEQESRTDIFDITINFASKTDTLDVAVLACEGFYMRKNNL